jgi:hypothetical protein
MRWWLNEPSDISLASVRNDDTFPLDSTLFVRYGYLLS